ncbi:MAG: hypothetical protein KBA51_00075 [Kiritimatiellae bacterium]|nr:hypothetical protein [Kiritimatiellia bacterium]
MSEPVHPSPDASASPAAHATSEALRAAALGLRALMWLLLPAYLLSGLKVVRQDQMAVVTVWGRAQAVWSPGIHWTWPRPISEIRAINMSTVRSMDHLPAPELLDDPSAPPPIEADAWSNLLLTGDAHLVRAHWRLRYRLADAEAWLLRWKDPEARLRMEFAHAVTRVMAGQPVDAALRTDVETIRARIAEDLDRRVTEAGLGALVERVEAVSLRPPPAVERAFEQVIVAENERSEQMNAARGYAARAREESLGEVSRVTAAAQADRIRTLASARADARYFERLLPEYRARPGLIRNTLWQETIRRLAPRLKDRYVLPPGAGPRELRLYLGPEAHAPRLRTPPAGEPENAP